MAGRWKAGAVAAVFLGSVAALTASSALALSGSGDELAARDEARAAAAALAGALHAPAAALPRDDPGGVLPAADNRRLAGVVRGVLADFSGAEGGVYLARSDQFAGAAVAAPELAESTPSEPIPPEPPPKALGKKDKKKGDAKKAEPKGTAPGGRRDPPPLETPSIRRQCRDALVVPPDAGPLVETRDVGPSRVVVATAPVGDARPAAAAAWVMLRLTGPEQQKARLGRLQLATALSLAGVLLALGLAGGLAASLRGEARRRAALGAELRKAEHLAALGRMLAGVAHEVRNPLAAIRSTVQLWERLPAEARTPESLTAVVRSVDRLNDLVDRLLLFARSGHEVRRAVDLNAVAAETLELVRARADAQGVTLESDLAPGLHPVAGAGQAIGQVVLNLVANALQAMPAGGWLACRTQGLPGGRVELAVADTGPGVPAGTRDKVFEPFFTTRPDGTGLGLALCREVARQHGGDVTLDPPGDAPGATFRLTLPAAGGDAP